MYNSIHTQPRPIAFCSTALKDLRAFPDSARRDAGHQLDMLQHGEEPNDWKSMPRIGPGAREIRIRDRTGAFRVIYVASLPDAIHVLHCFQKKTMKTSQRDIDMAATRYRELMKELSA